MKNSFLLRSFGFLALFTLALFAACGDSGDPVDPGPDPCVTCVTVPGDIDNTMYEAVNDTNSNGLGFFIFSGVTTGSMSPDAPAIRRALLRFDVAAAVPAGATIDSVTLFLTFTQQPTTASGGVGAVKFRLHRVTKEWGEGASQATPGGAGTTPQPGDATWVHAIFPASFWASAGGDFVAAPSGSTTVSGVGTRQAWGSGNVMADDVQGWLDNPGNNFGWILIGNESMTGTVKQFASRQHPTTQRRPSLNIHYTAP